MIPKPATNHVSFHSTLIAVTQSTVTATFGIERRHREIHRERERETRETREVQEDLLLVTTEGAATSKFGNCFLDWLGARWEFNLPALVSQATRSKLLKF